MQTLWLCLEQKSILSDANIRSMKQYIAHKFPTYSSGIRANILADSVHRHINNYLPAVDESSKEQIRVQLLQSAYKQNSFQIGMLDVSKICVSLSSEKQEILEPLGQWLKLQGRGFTAEETARFIGELQAELGFQTMPLNAQQMNEPNNVMINQHVKWFAKWKFHHAIIRKFAVVIMIILFGVNGSNTHTLLTVESNVAFSHSGSQSLHVDEVIPTVFLKKNELTERYNYHQISLESIRQWLKQKNSLLAEEPYLSTIVETAHQFNIHPFLLLAIAGQEQSLVPNSNSKAYKIANNPFNVHHSWKEYNTDIADTTRIAAKTLIELVKGRPEDIQPLKWINRKYAEDPKWHLGVDAYFAQMLLQIKPEIDQS